MMLAVTGLIHGLTENLPYHYHWSKWNQQIFFPLVYFFQYFYLSRKYFTSKMSKFNIVQLLDNYHLKCILNTLGAVTITKKAQQNCWWGCNYIFYHWTTFTHLPQLSLLIHPSRSSNKHVPCPHSKHSPTSSSLPPFPVEKGAVIFRHSLHRF